MLTCCVKELWPERVDPEHLHVRGHRGRGPGQLRGGQRGPPGGQGQEREVEPGRHHQLGHRVRGQEQAWGLHQDIRVQKVDQERDQLKEKVKIVKLNGRTVLH